MERGNHHMDSSGLVLLLIVIACAIALIYVARKQKKLDGEVTIKPTDSSVSSGATGSTTGNAPGKPEEEKPSGPPQNTIYEFNAKSVKRLCPFCDGENSVGAKVCNICGRNL